MTKDSDNLSVGEAFPDLPDDLAEALDTAIECIDFLYDAGLVDDDMLDKVQANINATILSGLASKKKKKRKPKKATDNVIAFPARAKGTPPA
jgi:hypothetical protein